MSFVKKAVRGVTDMFGLTGDVPSGAQSKTGFFPPNINIISELFKAEQKSSGGKIENTGRFTGEGKRIADILDAIQRRKSDELKAYIGSGSDDMIAREKGLLRDIREPSIIDARNMLDEQIAATTGGLFTTPGGQAAKARFEAQNVADLAAGDLAAHDRAFNRKQLLEADETSTLNNLVAYKNQPLNAIKIALNTALGAAPGNTASAQMLAQQELANQQATFKFFETIFGGFMGTEGGTPTTPTPTTPIYSGVPTSSQAGGFGMDWRTSTSPFSSNRPQFTGTFSGTSPRSNYFMGTPY